MNESSKKKIITYGKENPGHKAEDTGRWREDGGTPYFVTELRVPFFEVDMGQAVYHGNYYHFFQLGREGLIRNLGFPYSEFLNRQLHLTVTESHCKYRKTLHYNDEIEIHTRITSMSRRSISFSQFIFRSVETPSDGVTNSIAFELCTECQIDLICVRFTGQPTLLPEEFRVMGQRVTG